MTRIASRKPPAARAVAKRKSTPTAAHVAGPVETPLAPRTDGLTRVIAGGKRGAVVRAQLDDALVAQRTAGVPIVAPVQPPAIAAQALADLAHGVARKELQPNLYTHSLGAYAQLATWIDQNLGNRDGVITIHELHAYAQRYGHDPSQHVGIQGIAMMLGAITVQVGNQISIANMAGGAQVQISVNVGGQVTIHSGGVARNDPPPQRTTTQPGTITAHEAARQMVRMTNGADRRDVDECIRSLAALPPKVLDILRARGITVIVASNITEYRPDLRSTQPRGWPPGSTWTQPAGMHDPNRNEIVLGRGGTSPRVVFHEVGHALDVASGWTRSNAGTFLTQYNADYTALSRNAQTYLQQPGDAGPSEAFAESHMWFRTDPYGMQRTYPNLYNYWHWVEKNGYSEVGG